MKSDRIGRELFLFDNWYKIIYNRNRNGGLCCIVSVINKKRKKYDRSNNRCWIY